MVTAYLLLQYAAPVVKYQQTDNISCTALFYVEQALFYVVNCSKCLCYVLLTILRTYG